VIARLLQVKNGQEDHDFELAERAFTGHDNLQCKHMGIRSSSSLASHLSPSA
jgi:hypothetical protein